MKNPNAVYTTDGLAPNVLYGNCETSYSIALLPFKDGTQKLAFRWNGKEDEKSLGTPTSHGKATWMYIPEDFLERLGVVLDAIRKE